MRFLLALLLCWPLAAQVFPSPGPGGAPVGGAALTSGSYNGTSSLMTGSPPVTDYGVSLFVHVEAAGTGSNRDIIGISDFDTTHILRMTQVSNGDLSCRAIGATASTQALRSAAFAAGNGVKYVLGCTFTSATARAAFSGGATGTNTTDAGALSGIDTMTIGARKTGSATSTFWSGKIRKVCIKVNATTWNLTEFQAFEADPETCPSGATHEYTGHTGEDLIGVLDQTPTAVSEVTW